MALVIAFNCFPVIRKYVIQPYYDKLGEESPEFDFKKVDKDEALFEDKGGEEAPIKTASKSKKNNKNNKGKGGGKIIS